MKEKHHEKNNREETNDASSGGDKNLRMKLRLPHVVANQVELGNTHARISYDFFYKCKKKIMEKKNL